MPNVRLRAQTARLPSTTVVVRPALTIAATTETSLGVALPQANVRAFTTAADLVATREVSDSLGRYGASVPDANAYYIVALQDGTWDSVLITWDNTSVTWDRTSSIGGVSANNLRGTG